MSFELPCTSPIEFQCPFCGLPGGIPMGDGEYYVVHDLPACPQFLSLKLDDYVRAVRIAAEEGRIPPPIQH